MTTTILYGHGSNEGANGEIHTVMTYTSRMETPQEQAETTRYALAAFRKVGVKPRSCRVEFYGDLGCVIGRVLFDDKVIIVRPEDL